MAEVERSEINLTPRRNAAGVFWGWKGGLAGAKLLVSDKQLRGASARGGLEGGGDLWALRCGRSVRMELARSRWGHLGHDGAT